MPDSTHLPNAPLILVLAIVRISQYPNFAKKFENVHEALLDQFPERQNVGGYSLTGIDANGQPRFEQYPLWRIYNRVSNTSLLMGNNQLVFEWTHYQSFSDAIEGTLNSLHKIFAELPNVTPNLVGLRYINAIMDKDSSPIEDTVRQELRGFCLKDTTLLHSESHSTIKFDSGSTVTTRFMLGNKEAGQIAMPNGVAVPEVLGQNEKLKEFATYSGKHGLLDLDGAVEPVGSTSTAKEVLELFGSLREDMRPVLFELFDDETIASWK